MNAYDEFSDFPGTENTEEIISAANELLTQQNREYEIENVRGKISKFKVKISSQISCIEDVEDFLKTYNERNNETLRVLWCVLCYCLVAILCVIYNLGWNVSIINVKIYK